MLPTRFARRACGGLVMSAALLLAIFACPCTASADAHHSERSSIGVVRFGAGYAGQDGSRRVHWIQRRLRQLGYAPGPVDGRFGPLTEHAVVRFQATHRVASDGEVGPVTYTRLVHARAVARIGTGYRHAGGSRRVRTIQRSLDELGYATGPVDGRFGPLTERAVVRFQGDHGLLTDGVVGPRTLARLRRHALPQPATTQHAEQPQAGRRPRVSGPQIARPPTSQIPAPPARLPRQAAEEILLALGLLGIAAFISSYVRTRQRLIRRGADRVRAPMTNRQEGAR
jgi:peptidoglycan hydrolase-like protein with peptidoglycan-binding domain